MLKTDLTNQRQVFVEEYVSSGDHLEEAKKAEYKDTHTRRFTFYLSSKYKCQMKQLLNYL